MTPEELAEVREAAAKQVQPHWDAMERISFLSGVDAALELVKAKS